MWFANLLQLNLSEGEENVCFFRQLLNIFKKKKT